MAAATARPLARSISGIATKRTEEPGGLVNWDDARYSGFVDRDEIVRVLRAFEEAGLEYVLIGATAMGFHGLVRATEDIDLVIRATPENVERLRQALRSAYAGDPQIDEILAEDLLGDYPAVRVLSARRRSLLRRDDPSRRGGEL